tara:strand:- start:1544 stop:2299 length:756 start_codon:yes stop_codon:yes gene_type:complete
MAAKKTLDEVSVSEKLDNLALLQGVDTKIDNIKILRGELPLEVQSLEDEIEGLKTRKKTIEDQINENKENIKNQKNTSEEATELIKKYEKDQMKVRNNREFDAINKELEFQKLEIELADKKIKEFDVINSEKKGVIDDAKSKIKEKEGRLDDKKKELDEIVKQTSEEEEKLLKKRTRINKKIEQRLLDAYERIRLSSRNGLAVVSVERNACGGCFNRVTPQQAVEVDNKKKIIACEHCGRIFIPSEEDGQK